jgi:hypothetical protein
MNDRAIERFRITNVEGPEDRGLLHQFHDYLYDIELDPGGVYRNEYVKVLVTLFDTAFWSIAEKNPRESPYLEEGRARLAHYVIGTLQSLLQKSSPAFPLKLNPTIEEVQELQEIDHAKVDVSGWIVVPSESVQTEKHIFVSCGQQSDEEIQLGKMICELVKSRTGIDGYFAENQHSLEAVTKHIFNAIHSASAFIAVMHKRDKLSGDPPAYRGSVWIEQEVAIAAFLVQSLGLQLPARLYVQKGVKRDGLRGHTIINPIEFETSENVIQDLDDFLSDIT